MASVTRTHLVDDIDGSTEDVENVQFALDGTNFEIDLSPANAARLRDKLERFVAAASPVRASKPARGRRTTPRTTGRDQVKAVREWATANGYEISARGRISKTIQDAFDAAH